MSAFMEKWNKMSDEEKRVALDGHHGLSEGEWGLYECSDCNPEFMDEDDEGERYDTAFKMVCRTDQRPDYCPRCLSYLSLGSPTVVRVTVDKPR